MSKYKKYPRTMNLSFSESDSSDDVWLTSESHFEDKEVICSEKIDGEATTMYSDYIHARSTDSAFTHHPSRSYVKKLHGNIKHLIPPGIRICGENVYAKHSIHYTELTSYFYIYNVFDSAGMCLSWNEVELWAEELGIPTVPVLYRGIYNEELIKSLWPRASTLGAAEAEGYVVRYAYEFPENEFKNSVAKFVRANHVGATSPHWMKEQIIPNKLAGKDHVH